jgi:hypothetical protein
MSRLEHGTVSAQFDAADGDLRISLSLSSTSSIFSDGEPHSSASRPFAWSHAALIPRVAYNLAWSTLTHTLTREREEGTEVDAQLAAFLFLFPFILKQNEHAMEIVMPPNRSCHHMTWNTATAILLYRIRLCRHDSIQTEKKAKSLTDETEFRRHQNPESI